MPVSIFLKHIRMSCYICHSSKRIFAMFKKPFSALSACASALTLILSVPFSGVAQKPRTSVPPLKGEAVSAHSFNTMGGVATGSGGSVSYSVGQLVYTTEASDGGAMAQGVQRPYQLTSVEIRTASPALDFSILPNPTDGNLLLRLSDRPDTMPVYRVTDVQGKELLEGQVGFPETPIGLSGFPAGTYLIRIQNPEKQLLQTLQVIKN